MVDKSFSHASYHNDFLISLFVIPFDCFFLYRPSQSLLMQIFITKLSKNSLLSPNIYLFISLHHKLFYKLRGPQEKNSTKFSRSLLLSPNIYFYHLKTLIKSFMNWEERLHKEKKKIKRNSPKSLFEIPSEHTTLFYHAHEFPNA